MKEDRALLTNDHAVIGSGVPMASASQKPIKLGDVLYSGSAEVEGYSSKNLELKVEFAAWRVVQINYKYRYYRIRDGSGCELSIHHGEGCPIKKLYHDFDDLVQNVKKHLNREAEKTAEKIACREKLAQCIAAATQSVTVMETPKAPVELPTTSEDG